MRRRNLRIKISGSIILLAIMACVIPGQSSNPAPVTDPNAMATFIAGTAQVLATQTGQAALLVDPSSDTLIVSTETATPKEVISSYGTSLTQLGDGSSQFIDHRAGVQIIFPPNWLAMRVGEPEYYQAWENVGAQNPILLDAITSIQNLDLNTFRVTAYDTRDEHVLYENLPKINVVFIQDDKRTLKQVEADERKRSSPLTEYKFLSSDFQETPNGIQTLVIQHQWLAASSANQSFLGFYKGILFKVPSGTVAVDLFIASDLKDVLGTELDQIVNNITLFTP